MTFTKWLKKQTKRSDNIGSIARNLEPFLDDAGNSGSLEDFLYPIFLGYSPYASEFEDMLVWVRPAYDEYKT